MHGEHDVMLPIGPYHPGLKEPEYFRLFVKGETIQDVKFRVGYNHRGIEKLMESHIYAQAMPLLGKVCGICNQVHVLSFCNGVESISKMQVPERGKYLRTMVAELERIQSHLLWAGVLADSIGFETLFMHIWKERETAMKIFEKWCGNRVSREMATLGGARWDITHEVEKELGIALKSLGGYAERLIGIFEKDALIKKRLEGTGILEKSDAKSLCVVGPVARASGINQDIRKDMPYDAYSKLKVNVITEDGCDCMARTLVRLRELVESCNLIKQCMEDMPKGPLKVNFVSSVEGSVTSRVEAPRGENMHFIITGVQKPERVRIRPPTYANLPALPTLLTGQQIADAPAIIISIDPCFSCTDRVVVYDEHGGTRRL